MKLWIFSVIIALAAPALAQEKPKPAAEEKKAEEKKAEQPRKQASAASKTKQQRRWNEDARHCLERPTNTEIIKCAEEYL